MRVRRATETRSGPTAATLLQRGRTLASAERARRKAVEAARMAGFNGAALLRVRRGLEHVRTLEVQLPLQRGRTLASAESVALGSAGLGAVEASTGPHSCECGESGAGCQTGVGSPQLQRGRTLASAERNTFSPAFSHWLGFNGAALLRVRRARFSTRMPKLNSTLQRGRTLASAESEEAFHGFGFCGVCFNGAALLRVRRECFLLKLHRISARLQRGRTLASAERRVTRSSLRLPRRFNGAALLRVRRGPGTGCRPCRAGALSCFNGAALLRVRRAAAKQDVEDLLLGASTGPHSCECGEALNVLSLIHRWTLQRGRTLASAERRRSGARAPAHRRRFNGAALLRVRREGLGWGMPLPVLPLQRGRTLASAESRSTWRQSSAVMAASTGPHSCECGEGGADDDQDGSGCASTGPHSCECGELAHPLDHLRRAHASTGPHSCECGEWHRCPLHCAR